MHWSPLSFAALIGLGAVASWSCENGHAAPRGDVTAPRSQVVAAAASSAPRPPGESEPALPEQTGQHPVYEFARSPFGVHVVGDDLRGAVAVGARWTREMVLWKKIEPRKGQFQDIDKAARRANQFTDAGFEIVPRLISVNPWAQSDQVNRANREAAANKAPMGNYTYIGTPTDLAAYRRWVGRIVEAFDGDGKEDAPGLKKGVKYWQVENEWDWRWKDSPEKLVEFFKVAYETIKAADPEAQVVLGGISKLAPDVFFAGQLGERVQFKGKTFTREQMGKSEEFVREHALRTYVLEHGHPYFDVISFHQYGLYRALGPEVRYLRDIMRAKGYRKPLWMTEAGGPFIAFGEKYTEELNAEQVVKYYALALANGVEVVFWSSYQPTPSWGKAFTNTALTDQGRKKPSYRAYQVMTSKLGDLVSAEQLSGPDGAVVVRFILRSGKAVFVAWRDDETASSASANLEASLTHQLAGKRLEVTRVDGSTENTEGSLTEVNKILGSAPVFIEAR